MSRQRCRVPSSAPHTASQRAPLPVAAVFDDAVESVEILPGGGQITVHDPAQIVTLTYLSVSRIWAIVLQS